MRQFATLLSSLSKPTPRGRMVRGVLANVYDKGAVTSVQLLTIPLLTQHWGSDGYGIWLMLMTVPTFIALSDLGFGTAAGVVVTRCAVDGDYETALNAIHSTIAFVLGTVCLAALPVLGYAVWIAAFGGACGGFSPGELATATVLITLYAIVMTQMSIVTVIYRGTHKFAFAMMFAGTLILLEGGTIALVSTMGRGIALVALGILIIRTCGYLLFVSLLKRREPWVAIGVSLASRATIRALTKPSLAALGLTISTAVILQGMILALGSTAGAASVAVFGATRTLSRAPLQLSGMFVRPSIPELTRAISGGNQALERRLTRINLLAALVTTLPFGLAIMAFGAPLLDWISGGHLEAPHLLFVVLALAGVFNATWTALSAPLLAMNLQAKFSYIYLVLSLAAVMVVLISGGLLLLAGGLMALVEGAMLVWLVLSTQGNYGSKAGGTNGC
ncbi:lipopolysaccharide biosynthesis protein [Thiobaca trueperi]|uniref:O-antigen/teichoic acid export membrane protein n=1 Tax=Thiobaca trueperi TaxID=127458 RepID=A0A4V2V0U9_9GAMM|nr:lipopolysaccharide biosynthesis protein [Thiobaca trueperi]TCT18702.1 O-antigen/teichoic acid export membrane protein [Thiobaca trueperi]